MRLDGSATKEDTSVVVLTIYLFSDDNKDDGLPEDSASPEKSAVFHGYVALERDCDT